MNNYDLIYKELCERVDSGELSLDEAEVINEAAAEKYLTEEAIMETEDFQYAYEMAVETLLSEEICEDAEDYLDMMELEVFGESVGRPAFKKYMSERQYQLLLMRAVDNDSFEIPRRFSDDEKFVKQFKRDLKKTKKLLNTNKKKGIKGKVALLAAIAAVTGASVYGVKKTNGSWDIDKYIKVDNKMRSSFNNFEKDKYAKKKNSISYHASKKGRDKIINYEDYNVLKDALDHKDNKDVIDVDYREIN